MAAKLPAARVPATDSPLARADPNESGRVLVQRQDARIAKRLRIALVMVIMREPPRRAVEQIQAFGGSNPQVPRVVLENGMHVVARQRGVDFGIVPEALEDPAPVVHAVEACIEGADPETPALVFHDLRDLASHQRVRIARVVAKMQECSALRLPAVESGERADPERTRAVQGE